MAKKPESAEPTPPPGGEEPGQETASAPAVGAAEYDPKWLDALDEKHRADVNAWAEHYHKAKAAPAESELHGLRSEVGKLKKAADPETLALLEDHETMLAAMKDTALNFPGVTKEDVEGLKTARELQMFLRGMAKGRPAAGAPGAEDTDHERAEAWKAFLASRQPGSPKGKEEIEREPLLAGGAGGAVSDGEAILKALGQDGEIEVSPDQVAAGLKALRDPRRYR